MEGAGDGQRTPLDDVDHLARSPHRAQVIQLFATNDWTRRELHEETDIPQPTLGRILGSFQERSWLVRDGETYSLTLHGRLVAQQFVGLLETFGTVQQLPTNGDFEPILDLGFDPQWLRYVDVISPADRSDWYGHLRAAKQSVGRADTVREVAPGPLPGMAERLLEHLRKDELSIESVFPRKRFESLVADPEERSLFGDVFQTGNADIFLIDDSIRYYLARHDDRAVLDVPSTTGGPVVRLTTDQQAVLDWVDSTIDEFRGRADPMEPGDLVN
jgi:predicted transcriptional regulator